MTSIIAATSVKPASLLKLTSRPSDRALMALFNKDDINALPHTQLDICMHATFWYIDTTSDYGPDVGGIPLFLVLIPLLIMKGEHSDCAQIRIPGNIKH